MKYYNNNHSVFNLHYHLIMSVKYRKNVIDDDVCDFLKMKFIEISRNYHIDLEEMNHDIDYIHVLFRAHPNTDLSKFINAYKSATSRLIKKNYPGIKKQLWREMFWTRSYCLLSSGGVTVDIIKEYLENQGSK